MELSHDLKWNAQIGKATAKANCTLGFLKRNLRVKSCALKQQAYFSLVRPQLEYCSSIWDPRQGIENNGSYRLEMVQRRAARWTLCRYHPTASVSDMLQELGWRSLLQRRCDARLVLLYKIKNGLVACNRDQLKDPIRRSRHTHDHTIRPITVVVNKTFLGHSKKSSKVSPQINRLNRVLMNLNERGEGIFKVFGVF